jgi:hypothetical protein
MKNLIEFQADLKSRRERFNQYRISNITEKILTGNIQMNATLTMKEKIKEKVKEGVGEIKRFNGSMRDGYFSRQRVGRVSYKAMI